MDHAEAVRLARAGDERGYRFLYEATYQSKYYLALKYMKNEVEAEDVMQEAYLKAFSKLDMLQDPAAFDSWLGRIVANTAKNILKQKAPMLFSDIWTEEGEEYQVEDADMGNQPEMAYTRKETQELVCSLIDSLSDEQRMCILMFHIEGMPISVIADTLECSENTVKSRLNYGRKNLRAKAEELQRKGYKLYSTAPIGLLIYLLGWEESSMSANGELSSGEKIWDYISREIKDTDGIGTRAAADAARAGSKYVGASKIIIGLISVVSTFFIGGALYLAISYMIDADHHQPEQREETGILREDGTEKEAEPTEEQDPDSEAEPEDEEETGETEETGFVQMPDEDYPKMIGGNLTKEELGYVLAYGPQIIPEQGFSDREYLEMLNAFCNISYGTGGPVGYYGFSTDQKSKYSLSDVNRLFASFSDFAYTEENDVDTGYGVDVQGDMLIYTPATINYSAEARIISAEYIEEEMHVYFTYSNTRDGQTDVGKKATLRPKGDGLYRIVQIEEGVPDSDTGGAEDTLGDESLFYTCHMANPYEGEFLALAFYLPGDGNGLYRLDYIRGTGENKVYRITLDQDKMVEASAPEKQFIMGDARADAFYAANISPEWKDISAGYEH